MCRSITLRGARYSCTCPAFACYSSMSLRIIWRCCMFVGLTSNANSGWKPLGSIAEFRWVHSGCWDRGVLCTRTRIDGGWGQHLAYFIDFFDVQHSITRAQQHQPAEAVDVAVPVVRVVEHRKLGVFTGLLGDSTGVLGTLAIFRFLIVDYDGVFGIVAHGTSAL